LQGVKVIPLVFCSHPVLSLLTVLALVFLPHRLACSYPAREVSITQSRFVSRLKKWRFLGRFPSEAGFLLREPPPEFFFSLCAALFIQPKSPPPRPITVLSNPPLPVRWVVESSPSFPASKREPLHRPCDEHPPFPPAGRLAAEF